MIAKAASQTTSTSGRHSRWSHVTGQFHIVYLGRGDCCYCGNIQYRLIRLLLCALYGTRPAGGNRWKRKPVAEDAKYFFEADAPSPSWLKTHRSLRAESPRMPLSVIFVGRNGNLIWGFRTAEIYIAWRLDCTSAIEADKSGTCVYIILRPFGQKSPHKLGQQSTTGTVGHR